MSEPARGHIATLRGIGRMAVDATTGVADLVQALHARIAQRPTRLGGPLVSGAINGITDLVYDSVRGATRVVGGGLDAVLAQLAPLVDALGNDRAPGAAPARPREALVAALNGVLGDYLEATGNPLAIRMTLRCEGVPLLLTRAGLAAALPAATSQPLVLVHGLCMNDLQWQRRAAPVPDLPGAEFAAGAGRPVAPAPAGAAEAPPHDHGAALARDLGFTPVYLHYNGGRHISTNGRDFAAQLDALVAAWPVPIDRLVIVGHSMGGLVARSAWHYGCAAGQAWPQQLRALACLGSPHQGAPLERGGHWVDLLLERLPYTAPFARLGQVRSAGIKDLRHGSVLDDDWKRPPDQGRHPLPLPAGVACFALAATLTRAPAGSGAVQRIDALARAPARLRGDGLVPVASALGRHADPRLELAFAPASQALAWQCNHLDLLSAPAVYAQLRAWLRA